MANHIPPLPRPHIPASWFLTHAGRLLRDLEGHDLGVQAIQFDGDDCLVQLEDGTTRRINQNLEVTPNVGQIARHFSCEDDDLEAFDI